MEGRGLVGGKDQARENGQHASALLPRKQLEFAEFPDCPDLSSPASAVGNASRAMSVTTWCS
jgi:hypothetical protein